MNEKMKYGELWDYKYKERDFFKIRKFKFFNLY